MKLQQAVTVKRGAINYLSDSILSLSASQKRSNFSPVASRAKKSYLTQDFLSRDLSGINFALLAHFWGPLSNHSWWFCWRLKNTWPYTNLALLFSDITTS